MKYDIPDFNLDDRTSHSLTFNRVPDECLVLEFGPATGYMTRALKEIKGCKMYLAELDPECAKIAEQFAEDVVVGDVESYEWARRYSGMRFDRILFADVLEHLRHPDEILRRCQEFLTPQGSIVLSVPNVAHNAIIIDLLKDNFEYHEIGLLDNTHIHLFTKKTLEAMLDDVGLHPVYKDATYAPVAATEFSSDIHDIPEISPHFWNRRPLGAVYQYVYEAAFWEGPSCDDRIVAVQELDHIREQEEGKPRFASRLARKLRIR